jgi:hypothetical protein
MKGDLNDECNRTVCHRSPANWYNHSTRKHYCHECALIINRENERDAMRLYGHALCTIVEPKEEESQEELWGQIPKILFSLRSESMDDSEANLLQWLQKNYRIERISPHQLNKP